MSALAEPTCPMCDAGTRSSLIDSRTITCPWCAGRGRVSFERRRFLLAQLRAKAEAAGSRARAEKDVQLNCPARDSRSHLQGQRWARMIEKETERRRARHPEGEKGPRQASRATPPPTQAFPTPEEIEAARTPRGGWTRATLGAWGVPWPPPPGWREALEDQRTGHAGRPHGWSGPVVRRKATA